MKAAVLALTNISLMRFTFGVLLQDEIVGRYFEGDAEAAAANFIGGGMALMTELGDLLSSLGTAESHDQRHRAGRVARAARSRRWQLHGNRCPRMAGDGGDGRGLPRLFGLARAQSVTSVASEGMKRKSTYMCTNVTHRRALSGLTLCPKKYQHLIAQFIARCDQLM